MSSAASTKRASTHYGTLEIEPSATLKDVKKAYRRLAVKHHPDRNLGNEEQATVKFREISEAYEVLSDESLRRDYDSSLKFSGGGGRSGGRGGGGGGSSVHSNLGRQRGRQRDPFEQFNTVFRTDPFFADSFKNMNELFDNHFADGGTTHTSARGNVAATDNEGGGWLWNKVKDWLPNVNIEVSTSTSTALGGTTQTRSSYGGRQEGGGRSTYTSRRTRTVIENGQRVTIQSLEKDGNKIQEKYIGNKMIERRINGMKENIGQIDVGGLR